MVKKQPNKYAPGSPWHVKEGTPFCCVCGEKLVSYGYAGKFYCAHHAPKECLDRDEELDLS